MDMIKIEKVKKIYKTKKENVVALDNISFVLPDKGLIFIDGVSGSGKTTLMNILSGLDKTTEGKIYIFGNDMTDASDKEWDYLRNKDIGIIFQDYNLLDDLSIYDNVLLSLKKIEMDCKEEEIDDVLKYVGLYEFKHRLCSELSAGQKQRVAIARGIIKKPKIILADEATGNLDPDNTDNVLELFDKISKDKLVVIISHDKDSSCSYADKIITLSDGKIINDRDNTKLKALYSDKYDVLIKHMREKSKERLKKFDLRNEILKITSENNYKVDNIQLLLEVIKNEDYTDTIKEKRDDESVIKKRKLSRLDIFSFVKRYLCKCKVKNVLKVIMMTFVFILFMVISAVAFNDYYEAIYRYIKNEKGYVSITRISHSGKEIDNGIKYLKELLDVIDNNNVIKYNLGDEVKIHNKTESIDVFKTDNSETFEKLLSEGLAPNEKQAIISKKIQETYNLQIGDSFKYRELTFIVSGISNSIISESDKYVLLNSSDCNKYLESQDTIAFQGVDITKSMSKNTYVESIRKISSLSTIDENKNIIWGREIQNDNEFIISKELADELFGSDYEKIITEYRLFDLYDGKYEDEYSKFINLYDYMGKRVTLVGIYNSDVVQDKGDIILSDFIFRKIVSDYNDYFSYDGVVVSCEISKKQVENISNSGYQIIDTEAHLLYCCRDVAKKMCKYLYVIILIIYIVIAMIVVSFIGYSIKENEREIGILRVLGISKYEISLFFNIGYQILAFISVVISNILSFVIIKVINKSIHLLSETSEIEIFTINIVNQILISLSILVLVSLVICLTLYLLFRKKIINLLNSK